MFDKKMDLPWKRTGNDEYPQPGTVCLIYFTHTGFSISEYSEEKGGYGDPDYVSHIFSDAGGFLGDEDVLWIPLAELPAIGSFNSVAIPLDYACDRKFMKWDDPRKICNWVELTEDYPARLHRGRTMQPPIPKGTKVGVTGDYAQWDDFIGVYTDPEGELTQITVPKRICQQSSGVVYGPLTPLVSPSTLSPEALEKYSSVAIPGGQC